MKMISMIACLMLSTAVMANNGVDNGNGNTDNGNNANNGGHAGDPGDPGTGTGGGGGGGGAGGSGGNGGNGQGGNGGNGQGGNGGVGNGGNGTGVGVANSDSDSSSKSTSNSDSSSKASAKQAQGQEQGQLQGQIANGGNATGGNSKSTSSAQGGNSTATGGNSSATGGNATNAGNVQNTSTTYVAQKNPVNTAVAGLGQTTAACRYNSGGGLQLLAVGVSLGHSFKDKDCERIALAQIMWNRGQDEAGDKLMCKVTTVKEALGDDCLELVHALKAADPVVATAVAPDLTQYVTHDELAERDRRENAALVKKLSK